MRLGITTWGGTLKFISAMTTVRYFDLPAGKLFLAKYANATVVKRPPLPELILGAQDC